MANRNSHHRQWRVSKPERRNMKHSEELPSEQAYSHGDIDTDSDLFLTNPKEWFRRRNPSWTDQEAEQAVRIIQRVEMVELLEELEQRLRNKPRNRRC